MMDVKLSKDKHSSRWVDQEKLIYVRWQRRWTDASRQIVLCIKTKKVIDRGNRNKTLSKVKPVENIRIYRVV